MGNGDYLPDAGPVVVVVVGGLRVWTAESQCLLGNSYKSLYSINCRRKLILRKLENVEVALKGGVALLYLVRFGGPAILVHDW